MSDKVLFIFIVNIVCAVLYVYEFCTFVLNPI